MARKKKTKEQARNDFHLMLTEIWSDYHDGVVEFDTLQAGPYMDRWHVGRFPKRYLAEMLLRRTPPTMEESAAVRARATAYQSDLHKERGERPGELSEEGKEEREEQRRLELAEQWTEESALAFLKKIGKYKVMKKVRVYVPA